MKTSTIFKKLFIAMILLSLPAIATANQDNDGQSGNCPPDSSHIGSGVSGV